MQKSGIKVQKKLEYGSLSFLMDPMQEKAQRKIPAKEIRRSTKRFEKSTEKLVMQPRTFLYMQIHQLLNLPPTEHTLEMRIRHPNYTIYPVRDNYSKTSSINLTENDINAEKPTFCVTLPQDDAETLNFLSDSPLVVTIHERIPPLNESGEETEIMKMKLQKSGSKLESKRSKILQRSRSMLSSERLRRLQKSGSRLYRSESRIETDKSRKLIALGTIDILQFFNSKRTLGVISHFLYPTNLENYADSPTIQATWEFYAVAPLLKELKFCNIVFITFESIFNLKGELNRKHQTLVADLYFQSKVVNRRQRNERVKICSFTEFNKEIICLQNAKQKWESLKPYTEGNSRNLSIQTGLFVKTYKRFENLLCPEGVDFNFNLIDIDRDLSLACNSMHRFVLTDTISQLLEEVVAFNQQQIIVEIYRRRNPKQILYRGALDLSIFLYPNVNLCRFAVELVPGNHHLPKPTTRERISNAPFAIINICLLMPITITPIDMTFLNANYLKQEKLKICKEYIPDSDLKSATEVCRHSYKNFDILIMNMIDGIIRKEIHSLSDAEEFFCCNKKNLMTKVMHLIACDFNLRYPTNTTIEFHSLMTNVYKELVQRMYDLLGKCDTSAVCKNSTPVEDDQLIHLMNLVKFAHEIQYTNFAEYLLEQTNNEKYASCNYKVLYKLVYDMETRNFEKVKKDYLATKSSLYIDEYFIDLVNLYINYIEYLEQEEKQNIVIENFLEHLEKFVSMYPRELSGWMLMHNMYRRSHYLAGMTYTRWKYENLYEVEQPQLPPMPKSRWNIYANIELTATIRKTRKFFEIITMMLNLGLYKFAEILYAEIELDVSDFMKFIITNTMRIFQDPSTIKYSLRAFPQEGADQNKKAFRAQVDGNLHYFNGDIPEAMSCYRDILNFSEVSNYESFQLSLLRYGNYKIEEMHYMCSLEPLELCNLSGDIGFFANYGMGKAFYYSESYEAAEYHFSEATKYGINLPEVWAFLALVNLKMNKNYNALECWKQARLNPDYKICEEILEELDKINPLDVTLLVERPLDL